MKYLLSISVIFQIIFVNIILFSTNLAADEVILAADEWCPYNCKPTDKNLGILLDIAKYSLAQKGHTVKYVIAPWKRSRREVVIGKYNGLIGTAKQDAPELIYPKTAMLTVHNVFYVLDSSDWEYAGVDSLKSINLGVINNYFYGDKLNAYIDSNTDDKIHLTVTYNDTGIDQLISLLRRGRIDAFIDVRGVVNHYFKTKSDNLPIKEAGDGPTQDVYVAFSPNNPKSQEYADAMDKGLAELRVSGKLKVLYKKYNINLKNN